jgi:tetratricopeptide (TPR) repeat protein
MELASWYYNTGFSDEAVKVLELCPRNAEREYWLCYLQNRKLNPAELNPLYSFPFRWETAGIIENLIKTNDHWLMKYHLALIYRDRNRNDESVRLLNECGEIPDFAPFYIVRSEMLKGSDDARCENDIKKAVSLDGQWRYYQYLANYYIAHAQYDKAIELTGAYYKSHPDDFRLGTTYARALLLGRKYSEADAVLTRLNIIPVEGATGGREMYREAKLMQAVEQMKKKNFNGAVKFISQADLWPENLGVGKPYDDDLDKRLESWMSYLCLKNSGKKNDAESKLDQVIKFSPRIENGVRNFVPSNAVITAWAMEVKGQADMATDWLNNQIKEHPGNKLIEWSRAVYNKDAGYLLTESDKDANSRIITELMKLK